MRNNKLKVLPNSYHGVCQLGCNLAEQYIGETKKRALTEFLEHQEGSMVGQRESSSATEHMKSCYEQFDWLIVWILAELKNIEKEKYASL